MAPPVAARSGCGSTPGAPSWFGSPPATSIPAIPVSPTTPTDTDGRPDTGHRHRRHEDRRRRSSMMTASLPTTPSCRPRTATPRRSGRWSTRWSPRRSPPRAVTSAVWASRRRGRSTCRRGTVSPINITAWQRFPIVERVTDVGRGPGAAGRRRLVHGARRAVARRRPRRPFPARHGGVDRRRRRAGARRRALRRPHRQRRARRPRRRRTRRSDRARAAAAAASRRSRPARTWRGGPARTAGTRRRTPTPRSWPTPPPRGTRWRCGRSGAVRPPSRR